MYYNGTKIFISWKYHQFFLVISIHSNIFVQLTLQIKKKEYIKTVVYKNKKKTIPI